MFCTYITIYRGNQLPIFYIGYSTVEKVKKGYRGTVASQDYKQTWRDEQRNNPHLFKTIILSYHQTREEASEKEEYYQKHFNVVNNPLYANQNISGRYFYRTNAKRKLSDETKRKIGDSQRGIKETEYSKKRNSEAKKGTKHTDEQRRKNSEWHKGRITSEQTKLKISNSMKGKKNNLGNKKSEESKIKTSQSLKGRIRSAEHSRKISEALKKKYRESAGH